jgi:hypothetical protein
MAYYRTLRCRPVVPPPLPHLRSLIVGTLLSICFIALLCWEASIEAGHQLGVYSLSGLAD